MKRLPVSHVLPWPCALAVFLITGCGELPSDQASNQKSESSGTAKGSRAKPVLFVGFDASPPLVSALDAGQIQGLVLQNPVKIGETSVKLIVSHLEGKPIERRIPTGELLATPENRNDEETRARLDPPRVPHVAESGAGGGNDRKKWRIMVIPKGTTHVFWQSVHFGANKAADELGNVEVVWLAPTKEDDRSDQIALVQRAVAAKMDGIVIAPLDAHALVRPIEEAMAAGIPVLIMDSALNSDGPISYVATDNYHGGVLGAERLAQLLGGEGKIILMRYAPNSEATEQREQGFLDTIRSYPKIRLLSDNQYAGATAESAQKVAQQLVVRFKGEVDGIFTPNESSTAGMLRALIDAGMLRTEK